MSEQTKNKSLNLAVDNTAGARKLLPATKFQASAVDSNKEIDLNDPAYFENRELSSFKFNLRVLSQARNKKHPLLERLMFLLIFSSNLDEFFEIRVSGLRKQLDFGRQRPGPDGQYPEQVLKVIHLQVKDALAEQYKILNEGAVSVYLVFF